MPRSFSGFFRVALLGLGVTTAGGTLACQLPEIPRMALAVPRAGRFGRSPVRVDPLQALLARGRSLQPRPGVLLADGSKRTWHEISADAKGWFRGPELRGGYVSLELEANTAQTVLLEVRGHASLRLNGVPHTGDPYDTGGLRLPVFLHAGRNDLLCRVSRGRLHVSLSLPRAPVMFSGRDATLPDLIRAEEGPSLGAVVVLNTRQKPALHLKLRCETADGAVIDTPLPTLLPLSSYKAPFQIAHADLQGQSELPFHLTLLDQDGHAIDATEGKLRVRDPGARQRRTFQSRIDGSVQYYALNPARRLPGDLRPAALFLSLHGAGVEASGQAAAYADKTWGHLVAPTNRRPFGFDWEDWGRIDALEVLAQATKLLHPDPQRIYLTGHSMGGHGTWHLGVTFPDRFAAIGPSAGWISFFSYAGAHRIAKPTPMQELLERARNPSDTLALQRNLLQTSVYILHGGKDHNVPVTQARRMVKELAALHADFAYHEQPGAGHWWDDSDAAGTGCVDWPPMFDFFARHRMPKLGEVRHVDFTTPDPGISARCHWVTIEAQTRPLLPSRVELRLDPWRRRWSGKTENVARLSLDLRALTKGAPLRVELDGTELAELAWPEQGSRLWLAREDTHWQRVPRPPASSKGPRRYGPFKSVFDHRVLLVYGTTGKAEENAWSLARARLDAETFWYRGNGALEVRADRDFDAAAEPDRSVVLYGNTDTNGAFSALLGKAPVLFARGLVQVGEMRLEGDELAVLCVRPRPGSEEACVGVVGGTGMVGMRVTESLPYFVSGVAYPDLFVAGPEMLNDGSQGVRLAGFFGMDWSVEKGRFVGQ